MQKLRLFLTLGLILFLVSCSKNESDQASIIANSIIQDVGEVKLSQKGNANKVIIVFEESHMSRRCQNEIAIMLTRLYQQNGLRKICLEGAIAYSGRIEPSWFHRIKSPSDDPEKQYAARHLLKEGEISAAELMALVFPDISVVGIENESEYGVNINKESNPPAMYLLYIALSSLSEDNVNKFQQLYDEAKINEGKIDAEKMMKAIEFAIHADAWTSEKYKLLEQKSKIVYTKEILNILNDIENYAEKRGLKDKIEPQIVEDMQSYKKFFETADQRSHTMVKNTIRQAESTKAPVVMIIGAAHTDLIVELLTKENACFAIVSPLSMKNNIYDDPTNIPMKAFLRKGKGQSVDENSLGDFLDGDRKPTPVINKPWFVSKTHLYMVTRRLAILAAGGAGQPPSKPPINGYELRGMYNDRYGDDDDIDWESVVIEPIGQVLVALSADDMDGNHKKIWVKTKKISPTVGEPSSLEQQLMNDLNDLREGNPSEIQTENGIKVKKIARDAIAVFSLTKERVASINMQAVWR
jgi:hypothetical protein